jgi:hypothetical protein
MDARIQSIKDQTAEWSQNKSKRGNQRKSNQEFETENEIGYYL